MIPLLDSYFIQKDSIFVASPLPDYFENASVAITNDFDKDLLNSTLTELTRAA